MSPTSKFFGYLLFGPYLVVLAFLRPSLPHLTAEVFVILGVFIWWMWGASRIDLLDPQRTKCFAREDVLLLRLCLGPAAWTIWVLTPVLCLLGAPMRANRYPIPRWYVAPISSGVRTPVLVARPARPMHVEPTRRNPYAA